MLSLHVLEIERNWTDKRIWKFATANPDIYEPSSTARERVTYSTRFSRIFKLKSLRVFYKLIYRKVFLLKSTVFEHDLAHVRVCQLMRDFACFSLP